MSGTNIEQRLLAARAAAAVVLAASLLGGCRGQPSDQPPVLLIRNMWRQERYNPQARSAFFADHRAMRVPPAGTVPRENWEEDDRLSTGLEFDGTSYLLAVPEAIVERHHGLAATLARGRDRFGIYCTPCHGATGDGQGIVVERASSRAYNIPTPPTFHQDRIRHMPDGQVFATISHGVRNMPAYATQIPMPDRWAIVAYMRALQLSQGTPASEARP